MENLSSVQSEQLLAFLVQRVEDNRADLVNRYLGVLREALFASRAEVHPRALKQIASDEADALLIFLKQSGDSSAKRGEQLHQTGFKIRAVLRLSQVTRQFLLNGMENHHVVSALEIVDAYEMAMIESFMENVDNTNKIERVQLERVLNALHQRGNN